MLHWPCSLCVHTFPSSDPQLGTMHIRIAVVILEGRWKEREGWEGWERCEGREGWEEWDGEKVEG